MGSSRARLTLLAATALALVAAADAGALSRQRVGVVPSASFTPAVRPASAIDRIVIHVGEGSFWGTVRTLRDPLRQASAHFVVSREGEIVQLVSPTHAAWHAGNRATNLESIGIEHEGFTYEPGSVTERELDASARLVAFLAARWGIPLDRRHVIGHDEVPDPNHRGLHGGADHHTDPGPDWPWDAYMARVRFYAEHPPQQPRFQAVGESLPARVRERHVACFRRSIHSTTLRQGQHVSSLVDWRARACGRSLVRVDFLVDGRLLASDGTRPFGVDWNTVRVPDGWHRLTVRAYGPRGYRLRRDLRVRVENPEFALGVGGVENGQVVTDALSLTVAPTASARRVELLVDGRPVAVQTATPFRFDWDSFEVSSGGHELELRAEAWDGRTTATTIPVEVVHPLTPPAVATPARRTSPLEPGAGRQLDRERDGQQPCQREPEAARALAAARGRAGAPPRG